MVRFYSNIYVTLNEWNHLTAVINSEKNLLYLIINNKVDNIVDLSENGGFGPANQNIFIGKNETEHFIGDLDQIEIYDTNLNPSGVIQLYHKSLEKHLLLKHDFEKVDLVNNIVYDEVGSSHGTVINASANPKEDFVGVLNEHVKNGKAFESLVDQYVEIPSNNELQGKKLNNVTFMGWVKPDVSTSYLPIINKKGVFSFEIKNGLPNLKLGNGSTFHDLPLYSVMNMQTYSSGTTSNSRGSLLSFENLNDLNEKDATHEIGSGITFTTVQPEIAEGKKEGTIGLRVNSSSVLKVSGQNRVNLNLENITFGAWIKFDDVSGINQPIFTNGGSSPLQLVLNNGELELKGFEEVVGSVLLNLSLDNTVFDYSSTLTLTFADGVLTSSAMSHTLSKTEYTLPLYVECTLNRLQSDTTLLVTTDALNTYTNFKNNSSNSIIWGTGGWETRYAWGVSGSSSVSTESVDPTLGTMTKFSMFIDETEVIMYQGEGVEKYRFDRATYPSFWDSVGANNGMVRVGTWDYNKGEYKNYKVASSNQWVA